MALGRSPLRRVPGLEAAVFNVDKGSQIGPKQFGGVWWIIRCVNKQPAITQPLEDVEDDCRTGVMLAKGLPVNSTKVNADFEAFEKSANIQAFWPQYGPNVTYQGK